MSQELEQFRQRELGQYPVVYLDAHYEKVRVQGTVRDLALRASLGLKVPVSVVLTIFLESQYMGGHRPRPWNPNHDSIYSLGLPRFSGQAFV